LKKQWMNELNLVSQIYTSSVSKLLRQELEKL